MLLAVFLAAVQSPADELASLPVMPHPDRGPRPYDHLVEPVPHEAGVFRSADGEELVLDNGLVRRAFRLTPNAATVGLDDLSSGAALLRAVRPEARVVIDGFAFDVGGLVGQENHAYLAPAALDRMAADPRAMRCVGFTVGEPAERLAWRRVRHHAPDIYWPPRGVALRLDFEMPELDAETLAGHRAESDGGEEDEGEGDAKIAERLAKVRVSVHYELYDGVPVLSKWIEVTNGSYAPIRVDRFTSEILAAVERDSVVETRDVPLLPPSRLHVETEYAMGGLSYFNSQRHGVRWTVDPEYSTQVNYLRTTPCLLEVGPENSVLRTVEPGGRFVGFRAFLLAFDSEDRTRRSLALGRMYRTVAPWVTENPLMMHVRFADPESVHAAIDQCAAVGFEMVILTFGSGFDMEDDSPETLERMRGYADYARERGVEIGGYSLLSSRRIEPDDQNCIHPETGTPGGQIHGTCPALASEWGTAYLAKIRRFFDETGFTLLEHDGPYPGDLDAAARPPLQHGVEDSRYVQWSLAAELYRDLRARGVYVNAPDWYFLVGTTKCGMGYREVNWSLPRSQQVIHTRQNVFDGTREKLPSMGWMFVPLTQYHGGGDAATVEPLDDHLDHYVRLLASNLGAGVQACYRGPRLYDTERTRAAVAQHVDWFKEHRQILESPIAHSASRRADGRDLDWLLHVNPRAFGVTGVKGMLLVYNPLDHDVERTLRIDLYYTGLRGRARVEHAGGPVAEFELDERSAIALPVSVPAGGMTWFQFD